MSERTDRIRAQQAAPEPIDVAVAEVVRLLAEQIGAHADHPWHQVGRCVYCGPCGERLYQGTIPADHPRWAPPRVRTAADDMRARWGMD